MAYDCSTVGDGSPTSGTGIADPTIVLPLSGMTALPRRKLGAA